MNRQKWLRFSMVVVVVLMLASMAGGTLAATTNPPNQVAAPQAGAITKTVDPVGIVNNNDTLTYTIVVDPAETTVIMPSQPGYFVDPLMPGLMWGGFVGTPPAGIEWNPTYHSVVGMLDITEPVTIVFTAQVYPSASFQMGMDIENTAALCHEDTDGTINLLVCPDQSTVTNPTYKYLFLPLIMRNYVATH